MGKERILSWVLVVLALASLLWTVISFINSPSDAKSFSGEEEDFARALADELPDKCQTPEGYTDEEWLEHMGHHPDRYQECLNVAEADAADPGYQTISADDLAAMMPYKDFTMIDVHVPEQKHISGTDAVIPYDDIAGYIDELPSNKNAKILLYCRSGSMSAQAAETLAQMGYTNVAHLAGGTNAWTNAGYELED
ncbi:MAG: rhodanese-like domain-containing protein [bacterium]|nr:rhodanese-like domain-containing protein [bacterium]